MKNVKGTLDSAAPSLPNSQSLVSFSMVALTSTFKPRAAVLIPASIFHAFLFIAIVLIAPGSGSAECRQLQQQFLVVKSSPGSLLKARYAASCQRKVCKGYVRNVPLPERDIWCDHPATLSLKIKEKQCGFVKTATSAQT